MALLIEKDFGTPKVKSEKTVTLSIDGSDITVPEGCLLYTSPSPRDATLSRMPSSA